MFDKIKQSFKSLFGAPVLVDDPVNMETTFDGKTLNYAGQSWYVSEEGARDIQVTIEHYFLDQKANAYKQADEDDELIEIHYKTPAGNENMELETSLDGALTYIRTGIRVGMIDPNKCRIVAQNETYAGEDLLQLLGNVEDKSDGLHD